MEWMEVAGIAVGGGGVLTVIVEAVKSAIDKRKTPYDMLKDMLAEQTRFYKEKNAELEREKLDSAEKSSVIMQSHFCSHRFKDPETPCPVDVANDKRLKNRCGRIGYACPLDQKEETEEQ